MASTRQSAQADSGELTRHPAQDVQHDTKTRHAHNKQRVRPHRTTSQQSDAAIVSAIAAIDTRGDRRLADCAANISIEAWVQRVRGATLPPWTAGIDIVDLTHVPRPDPRDHSCVGARLTLFWAQWGDGEAARQLCDMAQDICSTDTRQWHLAPAQLRRDVALWHPIVAHANNIPVRVFVPVLAEIMAGAAGDGPMCVVCMCEPPAMVIEPCGHLCLCADDWQHLVQGPRRSLKCPLCRSPADAAWRVRSLFAHDEPAIEKPAVGMSGPPDLSADPQRGDVEIDFASIVNDLHFTPNPARSLELIRLLTIYRLLTGEIEPGAISGSRYGGFTYFNTAAYRSGQSDQRQGSGGGDDSATESSSGDDDDDDDDGIPGLVEDSDSSSDSDDDDDDDEDDDTEPARQTSVGMESTGLPFTSDDIELVASQARVPHDVAFDALLAAEGNIIEAIQALC
ncbi:Ring domain containing protein [Pandoravirus macleodensis]|uniref:Ring domain containing protein n=1 Tax=Pandoravirus macleodensis TaxID=2107707 RepID=A0A2U7UFN5_9VIRU|nr:Ring domain containing protein [Pandoravirus macleodensis]AVK77299.1 Ring domain containing protein [Pandoravirus macleodensis]